MSIQVSPERHVNVLRSRGNVHRIIFVVQRYFFKPRCLDLVMKLRGINLGNHGDVLLSVAEMRNMRNAIDSILDLHTQMQKEIEREGQCDLVEGCSIPST